MKQVSVDHLGFPFGVWRVERDGSKTKDVVLESYNHRSLYQSKVALLGFSSFRILVRLHRNCKTGSVFPVHFHLICHYVRLFTPRYFLITVAVKFSQRQLTLTKCVRRQT